MTKFVVDTNIVFSAILNPNNPIGQIIILGSKHFQFISVHQMTVEIENHKSKILKISKLTETDFNRIYELIKSKITFVNPILISSENLEKAKLLTQDIDQDDLLFVALSLQLKCKLWSGDKQLLQGLEKKKFKQFIGSSELFNLHLEKEFKKKTRRK